MDTVHIYSSRIRWTGNRGEGTAKYRGYDRTWRIDIPGKPPVECSNDPILGGDPTRPNPEDLLLSSLSACHMLWYLHLACNAGIVVEYYEDEPEGEGETLSDGAGRFLGVLLKPKITVAPHSDVARADALHDEIDKVCFVARSVNFPVKCEASYVVAGE